MEKHKNTGIRKNFLKKTPVVQEAIARKKELGLHEITKPLHYKANNELSEDKNYRTGQYLTKN